MSKLFILDRDGVINQDSPSYIKSVDEYTPIPGSLEAIAKLTQQGYQVVVATNQSGIGRGLYDWEALEAIHEAIQKDLRALGGQIEKFFICPHHPNEDCPCRKPKPGLLFDIAKTFDVDFSELRPPFVGDALRDLEAAQAAHCTPILVCTGKGKKTQKELPEHFKDIAVFPDLRTAVEHWILHHDRS